MRSTRAVLMSGLLAAAICSVALSAQVGSGEPQVLGFQAAADLASPAVFGGDAVPDLIVAPASGAQSTRVFSGVNFGFLGAGFPFNPNFAGGVRVAAGDINGDGVADVVAGQGPGGSLVTLINGANITVIGGGHPFGAGFRGGVYVATGDLNADGLSDIVVGQGTGGGRVMVFSGADISLLMNVAPFGPSFTGGVTVASGDVNGDGFADVFVGQASSGGTVALIDGATRGLVASAPVFGSGVSVALGDVNGDGRADAIMAPFSVNGPVVVYDVLTLTQLAAFVPYGGSTGGVRLASADFDGDGLAEIVTGPGPNGGSTVRVFSGGTFAPLAAVDVYGPGFNGGVFVAAPSLRRPAAFTSPATAAFTVGQPGTFTITTSGVPSVAAITQSGALPPGVSFADNGNGTATLSGTPAGPGGSFPLTFNASNGIGAPAAQNFLLTISQAPAITSAATANFAEGTANTFTVTTTGFPAPQIQRTGALPGGLTFVDNGNGTATLSGTAAQATANNYPLTITASNGVNPAATQSFTLTVEPDCPASLTFTPPAGALAAGSAGVAYSQLFTASPGSSFSFAVTAGALPAGLTLSSGGSLSGTPTGTGLSNFTITATSSAGCTGTAAYTLDIAANAQNDSFLGAVGNTQLSVGAGPLPTPHVLVGGNVLANDAGAGALTVTAGAIATTSGGQVAMSANGTFVYTPAAGFAGPSDTFTYTMTDANGRTDTAVVTIGVGGRVWYVNAVTPGLSGQSNSPFGNMTVAAGAAAPGDAIYVHAGSPVGSTVLKTGQTLWGAGAPFVFGNLSIAPTTSPTLSATVTLANNVLVSGLTINTGGADAIFADGLTGTETVSVSITGGGVGLNLSNLGGTLNVVSTPISGITGPDVLISGGTGTVNINAAITNTSGRSVEIQGRTAGTVTFSGPISDTGSGIFLNGNTGSTIAFTGGMALDTGANPAFTAINGGTVTATQDTTIFNTIATTTASALNVFNTQIGLAGLTFRSIAAGTGNMTAGNGITLVNTGIAEANGGLMVTGDGTTPGTGGRITRKSGADGSTAEGNGIYLANTKNVSLNWMQLDNFENSAIAGEGVHGFTLASSIIDGVVGNNPALNEGPIVLGRPNPGGANGLVGAGLIHHSWIRNGIGHNIALYNQSGAMSLQLVGTNPSTIDCQVTDTNPATGLDGLYVQTEDTANATVSVDKCRFRNVRSSGIRAVAQGSSTLRVTVNQGLFTTNSVSPTGIVLVNGGNAQLISALSINNFENLLGTNVLVGQDATATSSSRLDVTMTSNTLTRPVTTAGNGILARLSGAAGQAAPTRLLLAGNFQAPTNAIPAGIVVTTPDAGTSPQVHVTINGDNHVDTSDATVPYGLIVQAAQPGTVVCANVANNRVHREPAGSPGGGILLEQDLGATFNLEVGGSLSSDPQTVLRDNHPLFNTEHFVAGTLLVVPNGTCQLPSLP